MIKAHNLSTMDGKQAQAFKLSHMQAKHAHSTREFLSISVPPTTAKYESSGLAIERPAEQVYNCSETEHKRPLVLSYYMRTQ